MDGANHHHHHHNNKYTDRKSRWESRSSATSAPNNPLPNTSNSNSKPSPNPNKQIKHGNSSFNKKPTPQLSQFKTGPGPSNQKHQSVTQLKPDPFAYPDVSQLGPPPQPTYGFHMLLRRNILLADGTVRSYFALPPDYEEFAARQPLPFDGNGQFRGGRKSPEGGMNGPGRESQDYWKSLGLDNIHGGRVGEAREGALKRKFGDEERDRAGNDWEYLRNRQQLLQYGDVNSTRNLNHFGSGNERNDGGSSGSAFKRMSDEQKSSKYMKVGSEDVYGSSSHSRLGGGVSNNAAGLSHSRIDSDKLKKEFLRFVKIINETGAQRKKYLENGKQGSLHCVACGRSSKEFSDTHGLIMHTYHSDNADLLPDHLGLHKALCVLMGWNYSEPPDDTKSYQSLSGAEVAANQNDLIMWPPLVIIHNTCTGKNKEGRMEGLGNKLMDARLKELGFTSGKAKSLYGREGHQGITLVKFSADHSGLKEAIRLSEFLEKQNHGRKHWTYLESTISQVKNEDDNPSLVTLDDKSNQKKRILYGYLATAADQDKLDFDTRKKLVIHSIRETLR